MKSHCLRVTGIILFFLLVHSTYSQQCVLAAGGVASGNEGEVTFSVGQTAYRFAAGTEGSVTEGVQQPYEILLIEGIGDDRHVLLECSVSPNPAETFVTLTIKDQEIRNLTFQIHSLTGILLKEGSVSANVTTLPVDGLAAGIYVLTVAEKGDVLRQFKIIKR